MNANNSIYILSTIDSEILNVLSQETGIFTYIKKIIGNASNQIESLGKLLNDESLVLSDTIFIGDMPHDIKSAKSLKVQSGGITYGYSNSNLINNQFNCKTEFIKNKLFKSNFSNKTTSFNENILRTFRLAIIGTGEYTSFWGDNDDTNGTNSDDAYRAVVNTINRVNEIYENELQIKLELISDSSLLFSNPQENKIG